MDVVAFIFLILHRKKANCTTFTNKSLESSLEDQAVWNRNKRFKFKAKVRMVMYPNSYKELPFSTKNCEKQVRKKTFKSFKRFRFIKVCIAGICLHVYPVTPFNDYSYAF